ncbi:MAG: hypothetical protein U9Q97_08315, partial [Acidobacteriota bacterium]|nr:hypothetical protein [Acidobacteriota bacterium]
MKKAIIIIVVIAVILGALFLATKSCKKDADTETANTAEVEIRNIAKTVVATGKIEALYKAEIKSKIGGVIKQFYIEEGDKVTVGQKLVEIIPGATPVEMVRARTEVKAAAYNKDVAEKQYLRSKELHEQNVISPENYDRSNA